MGLFSRFYRRQKKTGVYCDGHSDLWGETREIASGDGYLVPQAVVFRKEREQMAKGGASYGISGMTEDEVKITEALYTMRHGSTDWLLCDKCVVRRGIGGAEKKAARRAAREWWAKRQRQ